MQLLRVVVLSVMGWQAMPSEASAVSIVQRYIDVERQVDQFLAKPMGQRKPEPVFTALRLLAHSDRLSNPKLFGHLMHYQFMTTQFWNDADKPATSHRVLETAKQWACAGLKETLLTQISTNIPRWLAADEEATEGDEVNDALERDMKDAIARFHEAAQVEIALSFGENDQVVLPKYMELAQTCIGEYL